MAADKVFTISQAIDKAMKYCSTAERCSFDVLRKLDDWGTFSIEEKDAVLFELITQNFVNEERYAKAFANDKLRFNYWGKQKIKTKLFEKRISKECIAIALNQIQDEEYFEICAQVIRKKLSSNLDLNNFTHRNKVMRFAQNKGFDYETINSVLKGINND